MKSDKELLEIAKETLMNFDRFMAGQYSSWVSEDYLELQSKAINGAGKLGITLFYLKWLGTYESTRAMPDDEYIAWYKKTYPWALDPKWREKYSLGATFDFKTGMWSDVENNFSITYKLLNHR